MGFQVFVCVIYSTVKITNSNVNGVTVFPILSFVLKHKLTNTDKYNKFYFKLLMPVEICSLKRVREAQTVRTSRLADDLKPLLEV